MISFLVFKRTFSAISRPQRNHQTATFDLPHEIDWRKAGAVTPIRNQRQCDSCWAFATAGAIESINKIVTGSLVTLAPQELVDNCIECKGGKGGWRPYAFKYVVKNGLSLEIDYPYTARQQPHKRMLRSRPRVWIDGYAHASCDTLSLMRVVARQPVSAALMVGDVFDMYTEGVFLTRWDIGRYLHAILIVGYCTHMGEKCWIVKNSWGTQWGYKGYAYVSQKVTEPGGIMSSPIYPVMRAYRAAS